MHEHIGSLTRQNQLCSKQCSQHCPISVTVSATLMEAMGHDKKLARGTTAQEPYMFIHSSGQSSLTVWDLACLVGAFTGIAMSLTIGRGNWNSSAIVVSKGIRKVRGDVVMLEKRRVERFLDIPYAEQAFQITDSGNPAHRSILKTSGRLVRSPGSSPKDLAVQIWEGCFNLNIWVPISYCNDRLSNCQNETSSCLSTTAGRQ